MKTLNITPQKATKLLGLVFEEWPNKRLSDDDDYEALVDIIQDMEQEVLLFLIARFGRYGGNRR